jgi:2-polyprenyl-3-methyl-5-hydroxy-6-metoxy-1,4-benzoquinol methylase
MLHKARRLASVRDVSVDWVAGAFGSLPCDEPFDIVTCNLVLCHLPEVAGPVAEMASCLAPGGRLIITDFHYLCLVIGWRTAFNCDEQRYHVENHVHDFAEYSRALADAGLTIVEMSDMRVDESLRGTQWEGLVDRWEDFPLAQVVAGDTAANGS